jgi:hypothetical protein
LGARAEDKLECLMVNHEVYSNVVVQSKTRTHVFFNHDRGFGSVKLSDLSTANLRALGFAAPEAAETAETASPPPTKVSLIAPQLLEKTKAMNLPINDILPLVMKMMWVLAGIALACHFIVSFCFKQICRKAGEEPGIAIWLPIFQMFPLLKAAKMSPWTFLLFLLPVVNMIIGLFWCIRLCQALGKSPILGVLLFLPLTNIIVLFYLAFSGDSGASEDSSVIKLDYPAPLPSAD